MQKKILLVSTLALGLATSAAFASGGTPIAPCPANSFTPGIIVGLQAGFVDTGWESMEGGNWNTAAETHDINIHDDTGFGSRIYLGFDAYEWLGFELGYLHAFNKVKIRGISPFTHKMRTGSDIKTNAIDLTGKLKSPTWNGLGLYAKAGIAYMMSTDRNDTLVSDDASLKDSVYELEPVFGVGLSYALPNLPDLSLDLSWTRYDSGNERLDYEYLPNLDFYALGIAYKFDI
jgi:opacity protein-like surface antigen